MAFANARLLFVPHSPSIITFNPYATAFHKRLICPTKNPHCLPLTASSSHNQPPLPLNTEQELLKSVTDFDATGNSCPALRTYENDLARLTLFGAVDLRQALTAAAADGGGSADEHLSSGMATMVVETLFPGRSDDHGTVVTRLVLSARKVKERAIELKKKLLTKEMFDGTTPDNILAMTFRQVVIHRLRSFEIAVFSPGTERNMKNLGNLREVSVAFTLSSTDESVLSAIGDVICVAAFRDTKRQIFRDSTNGVFGGIWGRLNKKQRVSSTHSSVVLYNLLEHEILTNAKNLLKKFHLERGKRNDKGPKLKSSWWIPIAFSKLEKIGGREFCIWARDFLPAYTLEIDSDKFNGLEFGGWKKTNGNRWQVVLTHSQMVNLADILDMYYEDIFTLPNKKLPCHVVANPSDWDKTKDVSCLNILSSVLVCGILLVTVSVLGKIRLPRLSVNFHGRKSQAAFSDVILVPHHSVELLETCCVSIIRRIKDSFGWSDEIWTKSGVCAWIGELPISLDNSFASAPLAENEVEMKALEDIGSFQVTVSSEGDVLGFQPTNRVAVNNWASNPLAKALHRRKNLGPGFFEPGLEMRRPTPSKVVVLELLMRLNPKAYFALVRAVDVSQVESMGRQNIQYPIPEPEPELPKPKIPDHNFE